MGKQIQILVNKRKRDLLEFLLDKGYGLIAVNRNLEKSKVIRVFKKNDINDNFLSITTIYVHKIDYIKNANIFVNNNGGEYSKECGKFIEMWFSNVNESEKRISQGRIYFENGFSMPLTEEETEIGSTIYKEIVKWVKKNIPYRLIKDNIRGNIVEYKIYVEDYLYELIMNEEFILM